MKLKDLLFKPVSLFKKDKAKIEKKSYSDYVNILPYDVTLLYDIFPFLKRYSFDLNTLNDLVNTYVFGTIHAVISYYQFCIRLIDFEIYEGRDKQIDNCHFASLMENPNDNITFRGLLEYWTISTLLTGNFYAEIRRLGSKAVALYPLQPHRMKIKYDSNTHDIVYVYTYPKGYEQIQQILRKEDVLHLKTVNIIDDYYGFPKLFASHDYVKLMNFVNRYLEDYFKKAPFVAGVLEIDKKLSDDVYDRVRKQFRDLYTGIDKSFGVPVLEGGLKFKELKGGVGDDKVLEVEERIVNKILSLFHIDPELINLREPRGRTIVKDLRRKFWQDVMIPFALLFEDSINTIENKKKLLPESERKLKLKLSFDNVGALGEDGLTKARVSGILFDRGIMSINEIRQRFYKMPSVEGGDKRYVALNMMPVESGRKPENEQGRPDSETNPPPKKPRSMRLSKALDSVYWADIYTYASQLIEEELLNVFVKQYTEFSDNLFEQVYNDIVNNRKRKAEDKLLKYLLAFDNDIRLAFIVVATSIYTDMLYRLALEDVRLPAYLPLDLRSELDKWADTFSDIVNITTAKDIVKEIDNSIKNKVQPDVALRETFKKFFDVDAVRLERIVTTETTYLLNLMNEYISRKHLKKQYKKWITMLDEKVRELHIPMHGKRVKIEEKFTMPNGEKARFPADISLSPENRINCRCYLVFE